MRTLIIQLPPEPPSAALAYPHAWADSEQGTRPLGLQWAVASLLPSAQRQTETVVLVPALALSWQRIELPPGLDKQPQRLQAALQGLLEERLLDDPEHLHMALQTEWASHPRPWVAVCDRAWLKGHLQALEQVGLTVHRIVPEFSPGAVHTAAQVTALGDAQAGVLWLSHPERGVWRQPLSVRQVGLSEAELSQALLQAEPSVVAAASEVLGPDVNLMPPAQHWLAATASDWDLAQFDLRANARTRRLKQWQRGASAFWHSPTWRPARWGLFVLLAIQLVGLNAWAWKTRADWQAQQDGWARLLRNTFVQTQVVVDAPLQMAQAVERLRQRSAQLNAADLESMLSALGQALPSTLAAPRQWAYQPGQLRLTNFSPDAVQQAALQNRLNALGYGWRADGEAWVMTSQNNTQGQP